MSSATASASMFSPVSDLKSMTELAKTQFIYLNERPIILHRILPYGSEAYTIQYSYMEDPPCSCNQITVSHQGDEYWTRRFKYVFTTMNHTDLHVDMV